MTRFCRVLLIFGIYVAVSRAQSVEDDVFHFTNPSQGNAVWILDESSLPWTGGYQFLRSISGMPTTLLSVVDSSTGVTLGQCVAPQDSTGNFSKRWERFSWVLSNTGLDCTFEHGTATRVEFTPSQNPRTFSIRIQSVTGPACFRDMTVQTEQATGCPPHLSRNSFTANALNCSCPYLEAANEDGENENEDVDMLANTPQFPLFKGIDPSVLGGANPTPQWTLAPSPCAGHECHNNGTCLVSQQGTATCLCRNGFTGDRCELDVCSSVPCQNGGVCRSNNGIAYCECPPAFTGLLCESSHTEDPVCKPECSNGQCMLKNGQAHCECRQGFTGANCNVLDVCLGDAACSMFGPTAKCVLDDDMDKMSSLTLMNGTYDCLCPHPIHGQFIDCMQLHAPSATSVQPSEPIENNVTPPFPVLEISQVPTGATTPATFTTQTPTTSSVTQPVVPQTAPTTQQVSEHFAGFTVTREPLRPFDSSSTLPPPFNQRIITAGEPVWSSQQPSGAPVVAQTMTTFIFPQTPETTTMTPSTAAIHKFVSPVMPNEEEEEEEETEETFPTPSTMHVVPTHFETTTVIPSTDFESTQPSTVFNTTPEPSTTTEEEEEEEEDMTTEQVTESTTRPSTTVFVQPTTTVTTEAPTTTMEEETTTEEEEEEEEEEVMTTTTQTSLPFWMTTTIKQAVPDSPTPMVIMPHPQPEELETSTEGAESEEEATTESNEELIIPKNVEVTTQPEVIHHHTSSGNQSSAAASWIIAIIALIVLGLLLLATSLFILRYIRQSRKLHGKYNPAREEHNLSAAYAMPMSHIAKEERLI